MINNSETIIKFSDTEQAQLEEFKNRLSNLESEVSIATRNLRAIKSETERAIKDREYNQGLLNDVLLKLEDKSKALDTIDSAYNETSSKLSALNSEIEEKTKLYDAKDKELSEKEERNIIMQKSLDNENNRLQKKEEALNKIQELHEQKVAKLKEVISIF